MSSQFLISCGGDDDVSVNPVVNGITTDDNGKKVLLTRVGDNYISYDENGRITGLGDMGMADNSFILTAEEGDEKDTYVVTFNKMGLISRIVSTVNDEESDGEWWRGTVVNTFTYNASKQLMSVVTNGNGKYEEDGAVTETDSWNNTSNCTWDNGNLVKVVRNYSDVVKWDSEVYKYNETSNLDFYYGSLKNSLLQCPLSLNYAMQNTSFSGSDDEFGVLFCLGFFGVGPADFPTRIETEGTYNEDGDEGNISASVNLAYNLNSDNTISTEKISSWTYKYSYSTLSEAKVSPKGVNLLKVLKGLTNSQKHKSLRARRAAKRS